MAVIYLEGFKLKKIFQLYEQQYRNLTKCNDTT